jgi:hypothetical protein
MIRAATMQWGYRPLAGEWGHLPLVGDGAK